LPFRAGRRRRGLRESMHRLLVEVLFKKIGVTAVNTLPAEDGLTPPSTGTGDRLPVHMARDAARSVVSRRIPARTGRPVVRANPPSRQLDRRERGGDEQFAPRGPISSVVRPHEAVLVEMHQGGFVSFRATVQIGPKIIAATAGVVVQVVVRWLKNGYAHHQSSVPRFFFVWRRQGTLAPNCVSEPLLSGFLTANRSLAPCRNRQIARFGPVGPIDPQNGGGAAAVCQLSSWPNCGAPKVQRPLSYYGGLKRVPAGTAMSRSEPICARFPGNVRPLLRSRPLTHPFRLDPGNHRPLAPDADGRDPDPPGCNGRGFSPGRRSGESCVVFHSSRPGSSASDGPVL